MPFGGETPESYYDDGLTASMKGDLKLAAHCFERAIRLDNSYAVAYHQLGKCYLRMGRVTEAVDLLMQVVSKKPNLAVARLDLANALLALNRNEEARKQFQQLMATDPGNGRAEVGLAQADFNEGNWSGAMQHARAALNLGGSSFGVLFLLGRAAKLAGDPGLSKNSLDAAEKLIQKSVELNPDQPEGHYLRGELCFVQEQFSSAMEHYRAADDRLDTKSPDRAYTAFGENFTGMDILGKIGLCYQRLGRADRAREIGKQLLERDPEHRLGLALQSLE